MEQILGFSGSFSYKVLNADGTPTGKEGHVKNMLLDNFFTRFTGTAIPFSTGSTRVHVGTSSTPTVGTMTALVSLVSSIALTPTNPNGVVSQDGNSITVSQIHTATWPVGGVVAELGEVGLSLSNNSIIVQTRSLFKDAAGNAIKVPVLANESLSIEYVITCTISTVSNTYTQSILTDGVPVNYQVTVEPDVVTTLTGYTGNSVAASVRGTDAVFEGRYSAPVGGTVSTATSTLSAANQNTRRDTYTFAPTVSYAGGISILQANGFKYKFVPPIPKNTENKLTIDLIRTIVAV